jgi:hypothetical protein
MKSILMMMLASVLMLQSYAQQEPNRQGPPPPPPREGKGQGRPGGFFNRPGRRGENKDRIEMFKIQFISEKLALTKEEAESFWPVYEAHKKAMKEILTSKGNDEIALQEAMLNARKKYKTDLKPVLKTEERINEALKVDREFLRKVRVEMMRRKGLQS